MKKKKKLAKDFKCCRVAFKVPHTDLAVTSSQWDWDNKRLGSPLSFFFSYVPMQLV